MGMEWRCGRKDELGFCQLIMPVEVYIDQALIVGDSLGSRSPKEVWGTGVVFMVGLDLSNAIGLS